MIDTTDKEQGLCVRQGRAESSALLIQILVAFYISDSGGEQSRPSNQKAREHDHRKLHSATRVQPQLCEWSTNTYFELANTTSLAPASLVHGPRSQNSSLPELLLDYHHLLLFALIGVLQQSLRS